MRRFAEPRPSTEQVPYFLGGVSLNWSSWQLASMAGIFLADRVPTAWGIGFAGTLALLGLTCSLLVDRATWVAAAVAGAAALAAYTLPFKLHIVVAIGAAVVLGLWIDHRTPRRVEPEEDLT
jgi:predicted branched-subunit amino acid permease